MVAPSRPASLVESPGFDPLEEEAAAGHRTSPDKGSGSRAGTLAGRNVNLISHTHVFIWAAEDVSKGGNHTIPGSR